MRSIFFILTLFFATPSHAWETPAKGTQLRTDILNAVRPTVEFHLGGDVIFVVDSLRYAEGVAFASLTPKRPGGADIPFSETLYAALGDEEHYFDGLHVTALMKHVKGRWHVIAWSVGATDVWWMSDYHCAHFAPVLDDFCG